MFLIARLHFYVGRLGVTTEISYLAARWCGKDERWEARPWPSSRPSRCRRSLGAVFVLFMQRREEGDRMISLKVVSKALSCEMPDKAAPDKVHLRW